MNSGDASGGFFLTEILQFFGAMLVATTLWRTAPDARRNGDAVIASTLCRALPRSGRHSDAVVMKAPARLFSLDMWYGTEPEPEQDSRWVSPWAEAHHKLRQQELEIERCELRLESAVQAEEYGEADGLKQRVEMLRSQHPLIPREERIEEALDDGNFQLAAIFQRDLDAVKKGLGLPTFAVGQTVCHLHRPLLRGIVMDVDLVCTKSEEWVAAAGCLERGAALGYPADQCVNTELQTWRMQPFYVVLPDLADIHNAPSELAAWEVNRGETPAPLYLPQDALAAHNDEHDLENPQLTKLFEPPTYNPHRGNVYKPTSRLRLWQQQQADKKDDEKRRERMKTIGSKNPYDAMKSPWATRG